MFKTIKKILKKIFLVYQKPKESNQHPKIDWEKTYNKNFYISIVNLIPCFLLCFGIFKQIPDGKIKEWNTLLILSFVLLFLVIVVLIVSGFLYNLQFNWLFHIFYKIYKFFFSKKKKNNQNVDDFNQTNNPPKNKNT